MENEQELGIGALSNFKSMLGAEEDGWYIGGEGGSATGTTSNHIGSVNGVSFSSGFPEADSSQLFLHTVDYSASCSPTSASVFSSLDPCDQVNYYLPPKYFMNPMLTNTILEGGFALGFGNGYLENVLNRGGGILGDGFGDLSAQAQFGAFNLSSTTNLLQFPHGSAGLSDLCLKPNEVTYATMIDGYCKSENLDRAFLLLEEMSSKGVQPDGFVYNSLVNGCCKLGDMENALSVFDGMMERGIASVLTFNTLIGGFCKSGNLTKAVELLKDMVDKKNA